MVDWSSSKSRLTGAKRFYCYCRLSFRTNNCLERNAAITDNVSLFAVLKGVEEARSRGRKPDEMESVVSHAAIAPSVIELAHCSYVC
jgi:hypothetical protein